MATVRLGQGAWVANGTASNDRIFGNILDNLIFGNGGADVIEGGAGADIIYGDSPGATNFSDTASYLSSSAAVNVDLGRELQFGGDAEGDSLISIENLIGSAFDDHLTGNSVQNKIEGGAGNDRLQGGIDGLVDTLDGGAGTDTVDYSNSTVGMTVKLDQTSTYATQFGVVTYTVDGAASTANGVSEDILRKIENIIGSGFADTLTGNEKANVIDGGAGADTINGGAGSDTVDYNLFGVWISFSGTEPIPYNGSNGVDIDLLRSLQKGTIAEGDKLVSIENVSGSFGHDILKGANSGNRLEGKEGDDIIEGRGGNDTIRAGSGFDLLDGGAGNDVFLYDNRDTNLSSISERHWRRAAMGHDTIQNFETGKDKIDLRDLDANRLTIDNDAFVFVDSFNGAAGQLIYNGLEMQADVDGDAISDLKIAVVGLQRSDVLL
jgi:Ca2+-binding RTX toxin-like protein